MKAYAINSEYGNRVRVIELELEEKPQTYKVLDSGVRFFGSGINKREINKFIVEKEQVVCFDIDEGLEIYKQGINNLIKKEIERHTKVMNRFSLLKNQLKVGIENRKALKEVFKKRWMD